MRALNLRGIFIAVWVGFGVHAACGGTITGIVSAKGPFSGTQAKNAGLYQDLRYKFAQKIDYDHLQDFVIYIDQPVAGRPGDPPLKKETITQRNVDFEPRVLTIPVGSTVKWPNADAIFHNVFSMSETKSFNLGLYTKEEVPEIVFTKPGRVDVFCSIHTQMHCIILILPSRYFAKVNDNRKYVISNVPAGTYQLKAWQERLPPQSKTVTVPEQGEVRLDFTLGFSELPKQ